MAALRSRRPAGAAVSDWPSRGDGTRPFPRRSPRCSELAPSRGPILGASRNKGGAVMDPRHEIVTRLRRVEWQVAGVGRMYEDGRYCIDVLDQLAAARAGLEAAALLILEDHVNRGVRGAMEGDGRPERARELVSAVRRFVRSV